MKKQIKLTLLSMMLFAGVSLFADDTQPTEKTKIQLVKDFVSKSGTSLKSFATDRRVQAVVAVVAVAAVGCYIYKKFATKSVDTKALDI